MISAQCLWAMDFQCTGIQLLLLSAEKPYVLTAYIKKILTMSLGPVHKEKTNTRKQT